MTFSSLCDRCWGAKQMDKKLKPCPLMGCGKKPHLTKVFLRGNWFIVVRCLCGFTYGHSYGRHGTEEALKRWNRMAKGEG